MRRNAALTHGSDTGLAHPDCKNTAERSEAGWSRQRSPDLTTCTSTFFKCGLHAIKFTHTRESATGWLLIISWGRYSHQGAQHFSPSRNYSWVSLPAVDPSSGQHWSAFSPCRFILPVVGFLGNEITPYLVPGMRSLSHLFLLLNIQKTRDGIQSHHFVTNKWGKNGNSGRFSVLSLSITCRQ